MPIPDWVRQLFASIDAKDADTFSAFLAEDVQFRYGSQAVVPGRETVRGYVADFFSGLGGLSHELLGFWWGVPDRTCFVQGQVTYTLANDRRVTVPFLNLFHMSDAGIAEYRIYTDPTPLFMPVAV